MEVAFRLVRRPAPARADGLFVPTASAADLLAAGRAAGRGRWPAVYPVVGGFVVLPDEPVAAPVPGTVRLRRLGAVVYIPVDADLLPALLPDELAGLTRDRGLVVLPGGPPLAFDPAAPVREADVLAFGEVRRAAWTPFPPRPERAEDLHTLRLDVPPGAVAAVLEAGRPDGTDPLPLAGPVADADRPPAGAGGVGAVAAGLALTTGQVLAWLGRQLGAGGLAAAGANLARRAVERVPRLSERVLGQQEAALRELLRQFQAGNVEAALRRAPAAAPDPDARSARVDGSARLSDRDPRYSLRSLLAGGAGAAWLGGGDVWALLAAEYHRLAVEASVRGDFRRAAYIYGVLLRDPRAAAAALDAGGLHRDAAVLYRDKVNDPGAAAAAFERAGDWDEAVALYRQLGEDERAADLLRRIGDEAAAVALYRAAAGKLAAAGRFVAAGELIAAKAGEPDRAEEYFAQGWEAGGPDERGCGERLAAAHVRRGRWDDLRGLVAAAADRFAPPRADDAGQFFAHAARLVGGPVPEPVRDDVLDRGRLALAEHLRGRAGRANAMVSLAFGNHPVWPAGVVRDAREAARRTDALPRPAVRSGSFPSVRLFAGPVVAAAVARGRFDVVAAGRQREACVWRAGTGEVEPLPPDAGRTPVAVAVDPDGTAVVLLARLGKLFWLLGYSAGPWTSRGEQSLGERGATVPYLEPELDGTRRPPLARVCTEGGSRAYDAPHLALRYPAPGDDEHAVPVLVVRTGRASWWWVGDQMVRGGTPADPDRPARMPWRPGVPAGSTLAAPPLDWLTPAADTLEVVGVTEAGAVYWSEVQQKEDTLGVATATATCGAGFRAACLTAPGLVAAATVDGEVHFLRAGGGPALRRWGPVRRLGQPGRPVFVAHRPAASEVVVLHDDGWATRTPLP